MCRKDSRRCTNIEPATTTSSCSRTTEHQPKQHCCFFFTIDGLSVLSSAGVQVPRMCAVQVQDRGQHTTRSYKLQGWWCTIIIELPLQHSNILVNISFTSSIGTSCTFVQCYDATCTMLRSPMLHATALLQITK